VCHWLRLENTGPFPVGNILRMRGCLSPLWDLATKQIEAGQIRLGSSVVEVEDPEPADPFSLSKLKAEGLLHFSDRATALQRMKIKLGA
jgi:hypothetical protein